MSKNYLNKEEAARFVDYLVEPHVIADKKLIMMPLKPMRRFIYLGKPFGEGMFLCYKFPRIIRYLPFMRLFVKGIHLPRFLENKQ